MHQASPLYAEGRVYFFAQDGRTTVLKAAKQFQKLAENLEKTLRAFVAATKQPGPWKPPEMCEPITEQPLGESQS